MGIGAIEYPFLDNLIIEVKKEKTKDLIPSKGRGKFERGKVKRMCRMDDEYYSDLIRNM